MKIAQSVAAGLAACSLAVSGLASANSDALKDSVRSWGPWAHMPAPAAGNYRATFPTEGNPYYYQPATTVDNSGPCSAGAECGFTTYYKGPVNPRSQSGAIPNPFANIDRTVLAQFELNTDLAGQSGSFAVVPVGVDLGYPAFTSSQSNWFRSSAQGYFFADRSGRTISSILFAVPGSGGSDVTTGVWWVDNGQAQNSVGWFVHGVTSPQSAIAGLAAGGSTYRYVGHSGIYQTAGANVAIDMNFSSGTWSGTWGGGVSTDGTSTASPTFSASGTVQGVNFKSSSVSGAGVTAVSVEGAVFGTTAGTLAGGTDVTAGGHRYVDVFYATR